MTATLTRTPNPALPPSVADDPRSARIAAGGKTADGIGNLGYYGCGIARKRELIRKETVT